MKFLKSILVIGIICALVMTMSGCVSIFSEGFLEDAKQNAQDVASGMKDAVDQLGQLEGQFDELLATNEKSGPYVVEKVVDGDTFITTIDNIQRKVRLIGVDTPESVATGENEYKNCEEGKEASNFTKSKINGKKVYIEYDLDKTDDYDRVLAYVYLEDGTMLNKLLLEKGYARLMTIQPNVKYVDEFKSIQQTARENKVGFWDGFTQWEE